MFSDILQNICVFGEFLYSLSLSLSLSLLRASGYKLSVNYQWFNRDFFSGLSALFSGKALDSVYTSSSLVWRRYTIFSGDIRDMEIPCPYIADCFTAALPGSCQTSITMKRHGDRITRVEGLPETALGWDFVRAVNLVRYSSAATRPVLCGRNLNGKYKQTLSITLKTIRKWDFSKMQLPNGRKP